MRKAQMFLAVLLLICVTLVSANAEILTIDLDNASYEEIDNAYQQLKQERLDKIKENSKRPMNLNLNQTLCSEAFRGERREVKLNSRLALRPDNQLIFQN